MTTIMQTNDVVKTSTVVKTTHVDSPKATDILNAAVSANPLMINVEKKKKKRSPFGILKAAMLMLRQRPSAKQAKKLSLNKQNSITAAPNANADWKKLVGSMRPLHLQESPESPDSPKKTSLPLESVEEIIPRPGSPAPSSSGTMSQYASASSLRDLDNSSDSEEDDPDEVFDAITGDEMIDSKAEEFIAQFYKQIQIQNKTKGN